jgi:hypothetical protein
VLVARAQEALLDPVEGDHDERRELDERRLGAVRVLVVLGQVSRGVVRDRRVRVVPRLVELVHHVVALVRDLGAMLVAVSYLPQLLLAGRPMRLRTASCAPWVSPTSPISFSKTSGSPCPWSQPFNRAAAVESTKSFMRG